MKKHWKTLLVGSWTVFFTPCVVSAISLSQMLISQEMVSRGKEAFQNRCSGCHGVTAEGNGAAANMLNPKPRNLVSGAFKLRSSPSGALPTVADLLRTIDQGIPGSSMPSFRDVSEAEKMAIVAFIRSLRPEFKDPTQIPVPLVIGNPPAEKFATKAGVLAAAKKGKAIYDTTCISCHGAGGKGDGPSAAELTDSDNQPIRPADLTRKRLKSGVTAKDAFKAIATGLDGSPMPGFAEAFSEDQRWDLTAYVFYLRGQAAGLYTEKDIIP